MPPQKLGPWTSALVNPIWRRWYIEPKYVYIHYHNVKYGKKYIKGVNNLAKNCIYGFLLSLCNIRLCECFLLNQCAPTEK